MEDYRQMWSDIGVNLEAHDGLLEVLPPLFGDVIVSQENRPARMAYFDSFFAEIHGRRIWELVQEQKQGKKVIGSFCTYVPEEILMALGASSVGLCGGAEVAPEAVDQYLPHNTCALIRSSLGFKLGRVCPYFETSDLVIGETTCDGKKKAYELFADYAPLHVMELPRMKRPQDYALWRSELDRLVAKLTEVTGRELSAEALARSIKEVNDKRRALQRLNAARKASPVPISGLDALLAVQIAFYDDVPRFTQMVNKIADELEARIAAGQGVAPKDAPRLLVTGSPMSIPNWKLHDIIEKAGAVVVAEELCTGSRYYEKLVPETADTVEGMLDDIAGKYLDINCACFTPNTGRAEDVLRLAKEYNVDGVVNYSLRFCAPYTIEATSLERAVRDAGYNYLNIDTDYSAGDAGQLTTRVEAFLEMIAQA